MARTIMRIAMTVPMPTPSEPTHTNVKARALLSERTA